MDRYHRQMLLPDWGIEGQKRLASSHAVLVGCGALGCAIADILVRAGVGTLTIIDRDVVELTNLQRQTLFDEADAAAGLPKAEAARKRLAQVNSGVRIIAHIADFTPRNAWRLTEGASVILDGTDNFETRYLINDVAVKRSVPYVYGGAVALQGMSMSVIPGVTPCLRCVFEEPPPPGTAATCDTAGVFGPIIAIIAACEAGDGLRLMLGNPAGLGAAGNAMLDVELGVHRFRRTDVRDARRAECPCCGLKRFEFLDGGHERSAEYLCGQNAVQVASSREGGIDLAALKARLEPHGSFSSVGTLLLRGTLKADKGEGGEVIGLTVFADGRAIIRGTQRPELARSIYSRYVGS